jgi:uncharacterized membrane protein YkvA (DUF1232 family)
VTERWWQIPAGILAGLAALWLVLLLSLWSARRRVPRDLAWRDALRLLPDTVRLLRRLAADPTVPRGVRVRLALLLGYLLLPFDLVPDMIPVLGYADDALVMVIAVRSAVRHAGPETVARHWPGTPAGLAALYVLAGTPPEPDGDVGQ